MMRSAIGNKQAAVTAETEWRRRCEAEGAVDPPERLMLVQGRVEEAVRVLDALLLRFPSTK